MRLCKSLLCAFPALVLGAGTAFAGQDATAEESLEESEVIYVYPVEVTEYYLVIPSDSSEMPG